MAISAGRIIGAVAVGVGAAALLGACTGRRTPADGPMAALSQDLMTRLRPGSLGSSPRLDVTRDAVRQVQGEDGRTRGAYDGTRLLVAADAHAYGTPTIGTAEVDRKGDGFATFNEIRQVVRHFDADASGAYDHAETREFERAVGIRWLPA